MYTIDRVHLVSITVNSCQSIRIVNMFIEYSVCKSFEFKIQTFRFNDIV